MTAQQIKVWDIFIRVFHWSLVAAFAIAYLTEGEGGWQALHTYAGYTVAALLAWRMVWGLIGTRHARFSDFAYRPAQVRRFLSDTLKLRARRYIGHNPAGGWMIFLMIGSLLLTAFSGMAVYSAEEHAGPLAAMSSTLAPWEDTLEEVHEVFANLSLLLIFVHVAGVLVESFIHHENLAKAMLTGRKRALDGGSDA